MAARRIKMNSALGAYLTEAGQLPQDVLLGTLVLYTISDGEYSLTDLAKHWADLGLDPKYLPVANKPIDAYRKATSEVDDFEYPLPDDKVAHVLVRDVRSDTEVIVRHLTREIRDSQAQKLAYAKIGTATFYRPTQDSQGRVVQGSERFKLHVDNSSLEPDERAAMQVLVDEVSRRYDRYVNYLDGQKIRAMVRAYLSDIGALNVKPSVYFVHVSKTDEIEKLKQVIDRLGESSMHHLPVIDLPSQRAMVVEAFQQEAVASLEDLVKEITRVRESRKSITGDAYAKLKAQYDATLARTREYSRLLGSVRSKTEGAEEIAQEALKRLQKEMTA
jgi:CRISPR/Cas system-associated endoribonuclease Cas2